MSEINIQIVMNILKSDKFKQNLIQHINDNVNIPILNENTEEKIFTALYEMVLIAVELALSD